MLPICFNHVCGFLYKLKLLLFAFVVYFDTNQRRNAQRYLEDMQAHTRRRSGIKYNRQKQNTDPLALEGWGGRVWVARGGFLEEQA